MPSLGRLPPEPKYPDLPVWNHNRDDVETRILNAAWNALFTTDVGDLSFKALAKEVGVTAPAIYHHFASIPALGARLARLASLKLQREMAEDLEEGGPQPALVREVLNKYLVFAEKRPRHLALIFSPGFNDADDFPEVAATRKALFEVMRDVLGLELGKQPTPPQVHVFWAIVHGSASLVAAGQLPHPRQVMQAIERYFEDLKAPRPSAR